ncbi:hypothetical protein CR513_21111, partial [Mucuna pruriens]
MMNEFEISDLGLLSYFLGIEFEITKYGTVMHQSNYLCNTRPDLSFSVGLINRFMQESRQSHLLAAKRILRYVQGTIGFGVLFSKDKSDRKSTTRYIFFYGGVPISWSSTKEPVVALSSCEAEYIATSKTTCQAIWLEALKKDLQVENLEKIKLPVDNRSSIYLERHPASHGRSKHIETRFHYLREQASNENLQIKHCKTKIQFAYILTKALKLEKFRWLRDSIRIVRSWKCNFELRRSIAKTNSSLLRTQKFDDM